MTANPVRFVLALITGTLFLWLTACGPSATPASAPASTSAPAAAATVAAAPPSAAQSVPAAAATAAPSGSGANLPSSAAPIDRKIIKNAQLTMVVSSVDVALVRLTGIASDVGGYLVGSRTFLENNRKGAQVTLAVPVDAYEQSLNLVRKVAVTIENDLSTSSDVTAQFTDLQSRLTNLLATEARIREFLAKAQTVDEALKVNAQLSDVDRQIEEIKGQLNVLTARTTVSTITVDLREPVPTPTPTATPTLTPTPTPIAWRPDQTFQSAVTVQTNLVKVLGDLLIRLAVVVLPYLLVFLLLLMLIRWLARKIVRPRAPKAAEAHHENSAG